MNNWLKKRQKGLSLIELLIAITLFVTVSVLAVNVLINIIRIQGRLNLENAIYEDSRFMMERISRAARNNAIDYEEYFNQAMSTNNQYGDLYGCYAAQFYNPGTPAVLPGPNDLLGASCNDGTAYTGQDCVVYKPSVDLNTGTFPYLGKVGVASNAFCPLVLGGVCTVSNSNQRDQLYLISSDGKTKTVFAAKQVKSNPEYSLAEVKIQGNDTNNDGITEQWRGCSAGNPFCCSSGYDCPAAMTSLKQYLNPGIFDASKIYTGFVPISPLRSNVKNLKFTVTPGNDPRKAFVNASSNNLQPRVTISLTVEPSALELAKYGNPTDIPTITLQTTISSRIQSEVKSYLGSDTYKIGQKITDSPAGWLPTNPATPVDVSGYYCHL